MRKQWVVAASVVLTLTACGGAGGAPKGSDQSDVSQVMCRQDGDAFGLFVAQRLDAGDSRTTIWDEVLKTCPERRSDLAAAFAGIDSAGDACSIPKGERDDSQERLAEATGC